MVLAAVPAASDGIVETFHPQDLVCVGLVGAGLAEALRRRWVATGVLFGVAFLCKQFAVPASRGGAGRRARVARARRASSSPPLVVVGCGLIPFAAVDPSRDVEHPQRRQHRRGGQAHHGDGGRHDRPVGVDQARDRPRRARRPGAGDGAVGAVAGGRPPAVARRADRARHRLSRRRASWPRCGSRATTSWPSAPDCSSSTWPRGACPVRSFLWIALTGVLVEQSGGLPTTPLAAFLAFGAALSAVVIALRRRSRPVPVPRNTFPVPRTSPAAPASPKPTRSPTAARPQPR